MTKVTTGAKIATAITFLVLLGLAALTILTTLGVYNSTQLTWKEYVFESEGMAAKFPREPEKTVKTEKLTADLTLREITYTAGTSEAAFVIGVYNFPVNISQMGKPEQILEDLVKRLGSASGATIISSTPTKFESKPAYDFVIKLTNSNQTGYMKGKVIATDRAIYSLSVLSPNQEMKDYDLFRQSFRIFN